MEAGEKVCSRHSLVALSQEWSRSHDHDLSPESLFFIPTQTMPFCFKYFRLLCRAEEFKFHGMASVG